MKIKIEIELGFSSFHRLLLRVLYFLKTVLTPCGSKVKCENGVSEKCVDDDFFVVMTNTRKLNLEKSLNLQVY